jgi:hypothetical protein
MLLQEFLHCFGLVGGKVVQHDVDLRPPSLAEQLGQKGDELGAGVPSGCLALHLAGLHIQSRIPRKRAVAIVFEAIPFRSPGDDGNTGSSRSRA